MQPNPRYPNVTLMITRRVNNRKARLRPDKWLNQAIGYVLAICANHYGIEVVAFCALPNHYHLVVRDPRGQLSNFKRDFHSVFAQLVMQHYNEDEELLWTPRPTNEVEPLTGEAVLRRIAYVMANPVHHGLIQEAKKWPGLRLCWPRTGTPNRTPGQRTFKRPRGFFRELKWREGMTTGAGRPKINWAETATLTLHRPAGFEGKDDNDVIIKLARAIDDREEKARKEHKNFRGRRAVRQMSRQERSARTDKDKEFPREPRFAGPPELREARYEGLREWRRQYHEARLAFPTNREVVFPYGTNQMRERHGVNVAPPPDV